MRRMYGTKESEAFVLAQTDVHAVEVEHWCRGRLLARHEAADTAAARAWMASRPVIWEDPGPAVALAPQSNDNGQTVDYILVDEARAQSWWFDDCEAWPAERRRFIFIADMTS